MRTKSIRCLDRLLLALAFTTLIYATAGAQGPTPGQNINMVSGTTFPGGDPFLQRQNEPSIAVSTRNPLHLLAGANDYRTVDLPLTDQLSPELAGNAWLGMFKSFDGGATWRSTLLPGFPQDQSSFGLSSPLKGQTTASDAVVRAGPNGLFFYSGIASNPNTKQGVVFVARFIDLNNKENGNIVQNGDPIKYLGEGVVRTGNTGQFLDKPWLAVGLPGSTTAGTCSIQVTANGTTVTQSFPTPPVYLAWTEFVGNDNLIRTKLYFSRSLDCGVTWGNPTKLSEGYPVNQGSTVGVDPSTGYVYVAWRTFVAASSPDSINIVKSIDGGQTFTKGITVVTLPSYDPNNPTAPSFFDQGTTNTSFRTNAFPAMAIDGSGRIYLAWSQRGIGPNGDARIMMKTSLDGFNWSPAFPVDNGPLTDDKGNMFPRGHQLMPQITFVGGKLFVLYYDLRLDHTRGFFDTVATFPGPDAQGRFFLETRQTEGAPPDTVFTPFIDDFGLTQRRHTIEVVVAQASPGDMPAFSTARVSQYRFGTLGDGSSTLEQLQVDPPNLPMFRGGTVPFFGDYIDIAGPMSQTMSGLSSATPNTTSTPPTSPVVYATWTSNQDVRPPANGNWQNYTPIHFGTGQSVFDPTQVEPACLSGNEGSRNQNIYSSRITQGLAVSSPQNSKPLSANLQREFVIFVQNFTNSDKSFRLTIANQPAGGYASFTAGTNNPPNAPTPPSPVVSMLDVSVAAHSGISRPLFAVSTNTTASITVNVDEITAPMGSLVSGGLSSFVVLNPDPTSPALINPDGAPSGTDIATLEIYNPNISNPNISNPNISNPNISNPNISNPNISNPNISNPNISNTPVSDATYTVTNTGNTSTSYHIKLVKTGNLPGNAQFQLVINKAYATPVGVNCQLFVEDANSLLTNIVNPSFESPANFSDPNISNPNISNATFELVPGETGLVTLRGNNVDVPTMTDIVTTKVTPVVVAQAANTNDPTNTPTVALPPSTSTFLIFVTQPSNSIVGEAIVPPVQVKAQDSTGAVIPGVNITLAIGSQPPPGGGTLSGTTTAMTDATGVATFPGLTVIGNTGTAFTLVASAPNALFVNSIPFSVFAGPVTLVNAAPGGVGDEISRGFYLPSYPGTQLRQVRLYFSADTGGAYTLSLSARSSTYGGTLLGTTTSTVTLAANRATFTSADFNFSPIAIAPGSTVTFAIGLVSAPAGAVAGQPFYDTGPCSAFLGSMSCSVTPAVIETEDTTPPLSTFRRGSVAVRILGLP